MPFDTGSAQQVYCGHVLEHVATTDLPRALSEIHRVLAPTGELVVVGPDIDLTMRYEPLLEDGVRHGGKRWPGDEHLWVPTGALTLRYVEELFDAHLLDIEDVSDDWPVVGRDPWQFALTATPKRGGEG
jgi:predicted SAM-dependent methyltransferase